MKDNCWIIDMTDFVKCKKCFFSEQSVCYNIGYENAGARSVGYGTQYMEKEEVRWMHTEQLMIRL